MTLGMKVLSPTLATAAMLAAAGAAQAQGAIKPVEARIINTPTQSVPVTVLNAPTQPLPVTVLSAPAAPGEGSREIYSKVHTLQGVGTGSNFTCSAAEMLPSNKRLVVEYLSAYTVQTGVSALLYVGMTPGPGEPIDLIVPAQAPLRGGSDDFFVRSAAGQQVRAYYDVQYVVCVETASTLNRNPTVQVRGYLVSKP